MIPAQVEAHLRERHPGFEHHVHASVMTAQELAAVEHISGHRVAKPVVVKVDGQLALAVVAATEHVWLASLEEATGRQVEVVAESEFAPRFTECEPGAEPPLAMFGMQVFVDEKLLQEKRLLMPAGTHRDAVVLETHQWMNCEHVQPIANLGR